MIHNKLACTSVQGTNNVPIEIKNHLRNIAGSNSVPSYAFKNDTNSGIFNPSTGIVGITSSGSSRLEVGSTIVSNVNLSLNNNNITNVTNIGIKNTNSVQISAQSGTSAWNLQLPPNAGVNKRVLQTDGTGITSWIPNIQIGGVLRVDAVNGDNTNAAINGDPFLTISAALTAASSGNLVYIAPGTYNETITIPAGVQVAGMDSNSVIIQQLLVTGDTTMVTMGIGSTLTNVKINMTSNTTGLTLKGILFSSTTTSSSSISKG